MVTQISNPIQLNAALEKIATQIMEDASKEILKKFLVYVKKYAYQKGKPRVYPREAVEDAEFYKSWIWSNIEKDVNSMVMTMFSDWQNMTKGERVPYYQHSSASNKNNWPEDTRKELAGYLDREPIKLFPFGKKEKQRIGGYWTKFQAEFVDGGKLKALLDKHSRKHGLVRLTAR